MSSNTRSKSAAGASGDKQKAEAKAPQSEKNATDGGNAAGEGGAVKRQSEFRDTLGTAGDPQPAKVDKGMVREETGISPEVAAGDVPTAPFGDDARNGKPLGIPIDTSGELRQREDAVPTAAHGQDARNGHLTGMESEGQVNRDFGGNDEPGAKLAGDGVRAEVGAGTLNRELPADERPQYPSTTLTRATPNAAPMEPEDVKRATEPKLGDVKTSTDPTLASAGMPSMPGDATVRLVNAAGEEVKPSEFFEVPEGPQARSFRRVKHKVSEVFTVRRVSTPSQRLLFMEGQLVDVDAAETLIQLHG